ncbi:MAG: universal stress protein [Verrucomicrobiota bacterium]
MLEEAVWPVSLKESQQQIDGIISLLQHFSTQKVHLLHVNEAPEYTLQERRKQLEARAEELGRLKVHSEISFRAGHVATAITEFADYKNTDFIILPWKTKMIVKRALLGNTVRDVIRLSNRPVAVYREGWKPVRRGESETRINKIMYATAFQATDKVVMPYLIHDGIRADTLYLLNVGQRAPDPEAEKKRRQQAEEKLAELAKECRDAYNNIDTLTVIGRPYKQILQKARRENINLIVAGKYDKASPFSSILGSIAEHLPHRSPCPILIIPLEAFAVNRKEG